MIGTTARSAPIAVQGPSCDQTNQRLIKDVFEPAVESRARLHGLRWIDSLIGSGLQLCVALFSLPFLTVVVIGVVSTAEQLFAGG